MTLPLVNPWSGLTGTLVYELVFSEPTPSNNEIKELHHFAYRQLRQVWRNRVFAALGGKRPVAPIEQAFLFVRRECAGGGLDWDNVYGGLKPLLDCLSVRSLPTKALAAGRNPDGLGLIRDDSPKHMPVPPYIEQRCAKRGEGRTTLRIFSLQPSVCVDAPETAVVAL